MALKSRMPLEISWALNTLTVLLHDDTSAAHVALSDMPGLLDCLVRLYGRCLKRLYPKLELVIRDDNDILAPPELLGAERSMDNINQPVMPSGCKATTNGVMRESDGDYGTTTSCDSADEEEEEDEEKPISYMCKRKKTRRKNYTMQTRCGKRVRLEARKRPWFLATGVWNLELRDTKGSMLCISGLYLFDFHLHFRRRIIQNQRKPGL